MSSNEEKRLKELGAFKKKIHKDDHKSDNKWKHDKYNDKKSTVTTAKPASQINPPTITFEGSPGY